MARALAPTLGLNVATAAACGPHPLPLLHPAISPLQLFSPFLYQCSFFPSHALLPFPLPLLYASRLCARRLQPGVLSMAPEQPHRNSALPVMESVSMEQWLGRERREQRLGGKGRAEVEGRREWKIRG